MIGCANSIRTGADGVRKSPRPNLVSHWCHWLQLKGCPRLVREKLYTSTRAVKAGSVRERGGVSHSVKARSFGAGGQGKKLRSRGGGRAAQSRVVRALHAARAAQGTREGQKELGRRWAVGISLDGRGGDQVFDTVED